MAARAIVDHPLSASNQETIRPAPVTPAQDAPSSYGTTTPGAATPASSSTHTQEPPPRQTQTSDRWDAHKIATPIPSRRVSFNVQTQKRPMRETTSHTIKRRKSNPENPTAPARNTQGVSDTRVQQWRDEQRTQHLIWEDEERLRRRHVDEEKKALLELVEFGGLVFIVCLVIFAWWLYNILPRGLLS